MWWIARLVSSAISVYVWGSLLWTLRGFSFKLHLKYKETAGKGWESTHGHYQLQIARIPFRPSCSWSSRRILGGKVQELQFGMLVAWQSPKAKNQDMVRQYLKHFSLRIQSLVATPDLPPLHSISHAKTSTSPTFWRNFRLHMGEGRLRER
jgi:hypothetical protein